MIFFWVVVCVFLDLCFPSSFPNTRKYFPENFLKCNQTDGNIFLFQKLAFPENMYFLENVLQQPNTAKVQNHENMPPMLVNDNEKINCEVHRWLREMIKFYLDKKAK